MTRRRRIVVLRALGLGDLCTAVPALRALRRAQPGAELVLAAPAWQEPLAVAAGVDRVEDTAELAPIASALDGARLAVNLHGRGPRSTELLAASRPEAMIAFAHPDLDARPLVEVDWHPHEHEVRRWCRLLSESGVEADPSDLRLSRPQVPPVVAPGVIVVHPGAAAAARRWPAERFGSVVARLARGGRSVVLTGGSSERLLCERVRDIAVERGADRVGVLAGRTDLLTLSRTVADAALVLANDTGVAHLATAHGTPSVVLFGPTSPATWGPPDGGPHRALWAGHRGDPHGTELDPGLAQIGVDRVLEALEEVEPRVHA
jgi:ADP-heptose:LPS heptosyltransferase